MFTVNAFFERLDRFRGWLAAPPPERPRQDSADWYAGLCMDPHSFSDQLSRLQNSLHQAANTVREGPVREEMVKQEAVESVVNVSLPIADRI
jgi:hypothetical protein